MLHPSDVLLPLLAAIPLATAAGPLADVDAYWHVVIGEEIRSTRSVVGTGDAWAWYDPAQPWTTSQWLSEVAMSWLVGEANWTSLVVARFVLVAILVSLALWVVRRRNTGWAGLVLAAGMLASFAFMAAARPLLVSWIGTLLVGVLAVRVLDHGVLPRWWLLPLVTLWANLHGQWVIAPAAIGAASILYWLGSGGRDRAFLLRATIITIGLVAAGCLTPLGLRSLTLPFEFRDATSHLLEWRLTEPWSIGFLPLATVFLVILWGWLRSQELRSTEVIYVVLWSTFAMLAMRNVMTSALLLLPLASLQASRLVHERRHRGPVESRTLMAGLALAATFMSATSIIGLANVKALAQTTPLAIATELRERGQSVTVLNDYNVAGVLVAFGPEGVEVGIDGRAERYGADYIDTYLDALALRGTAWESLLDEMDPDIAVVEADAPIRHLLELDWGWQPTRFDGDYVLLEPVS